MKFYYVIIKFDSKVTKSGAQSYTNLSPELKISSSALRNGKIRICVFTVLHNKDDKVTIHCTVWLRGCNLCSSNIADHNT